MQYVPDVASRGEKLGDTSYEKNSQNTIICENNSEMRSTIIQERNMPVNMGLIIIPVYYFVKWLKLNKNISYMLYEKSLLLSQVWTNSFSSSLFYSIYGQIMGQTRKCQIYVRIENLKNLLLIHTIYLGSI